MNRMEKVCKGFHGKETGSDERAIAQLSVGENRCPVLHYR